MAVSPLGRPIPGRKETPASRRPGRFTNTAVLKFDGTVCWQQHLQVFKAIAKLNGWGDETAALQLFAHLEGEVLNVALLMPEGEQGLSGYYNSPERLAVFRRREIVDRFRVWESHSEQRRGPPPGTNVHRVRWWWLVIPESPRFFYGGSLMTVASPEVEPHNPVSVELFEPGISPEIGNALTQSSSEEGLSPLVVRLICAVHQENPTEEKVPPDAEA